MEVSENLKNELEQSDPETAFYLDKFKGKIGRVYDITKTTKGVVNFHVDFGKDFGIFYEDEVTLAY